MHSIANRLLIPTLTIGLLHAAPVRAQNEPSKLVIIPNQPANSPNASQFQNIVRDVQRTGQANFYLGLSATTLPTTTAFIGFISQLSSLNGVSSDVFLANSARLKALADQIAAIVNNEPSDRHSVLYDLQQKYQQSDRTYKLTVQQNITDLVKTVSDFTVLNSPAAAQPLSVNEALAVDLKRASTSSTNWFDDRSVQLMASTRVLASVAATSPAAALLAKSYSNVVSQFMKAIATPADDTATKDYVDAAAKFNSDYAAQWPKIKNDPAVKQAAADSYNGLSRQRVLKAQYGALTNFAPLSYEQVFYFSRHVVILSDGGGAFCSGIALTKLWIVTAGHCFTNRSWTDVVVRFDLDGLGKLSRPLRILDQWPEPAPGSSAIDLIDFSFIRVEDDTAVSAAFDDLEARIHAQPYSAEPLCIRSLPVTYREPVFAVGYPMGLAKTVHDYAYVWFPYKIDQDLYNRMGAEIFAEAYKVEREIKRTSYADSVRMDFESAYNKTTVEGGQTFHWYYDSVGSSSLRPAFGIDTDTSGGDSGSPIFDRMTRCIVGIFTGGQRDTLIASDASWREHEIATPISEVLTRVKTTDRDQKAGNRIVDSDALNNREELLRRLGEMTDIR